MRLRKKKPHTFVVRAVRALLVKSSREKLCRPQSSGPLLHASLLGLGGEPPLFLTK